MRLLVLASRNHNLRWTWSLLLIALVVLLSACQPVAAASKDPVFRVQETPSSVPKVAKEPDAAQDQPTASPPVISEPTPSAQAATQEPTPTAEPEDIVADDKESIRPTPAASSVDPIILSPDDWKNWPVIPQIPENISFIYQRGLELGRDPHAFSILGDCQSLSETFMGVYETDPDLVKDLPVELQDVIENFAGSFQRGSPTVKGGTTAGAVLWAEWHDGEYSCQSNETPLDCELRLHNPSIVILNLGTHYETRNTLYLRKILDQLIELGIVPILSTKADNREKDDRLNHEMAQLAVEYNLPLWNFYAAVSDLPNQGVSIKAGEEHLGEIYLTEEGLERHRYTALQALAAVWSRLK